MGKQRSSSTEADTTETLDLRNILGARVDPAERNHFDVDFENVEHIETIDIEMDEPEPEQAQVIDDEPAADTGPSERLSYSDIGMIMVGALDGLQSFGFALGSKFLRLTKEEREMLPNLDISAKTIYPEGSKEALAAAKFRKHLETLKKIPFSDQEKKRLVTASTIYAKTVKLELTPLQGLIAAYTEVLITRSYDVFGDML